jgi:hypothetical protein
MVGASRRPHKHRMGAAGRWRSPFAAARMHGIERSVAWSRPASDRFVIGVEPLIDGPSPARMTPGHHASRSRSALAVHERAPGLALPRARSDAPLAPRARSRPGYVLQERDRIPPRAPGQIGPRARAGPHRRRRAGSSSPPSGGPRFDAEPQDPAGARQRRFRIVSRGRLLRPDGASLPTNRSSSTTIGSERTRDHGVSRNERRRVSEAYVSAIGEPRSARSAHLPCVASAAAARRHRPDHHHRDHRDHHPRSFFRGAAEFPERDTAEFLEPSWPRGSSRPGGGGRRRSSARPPAVGPASIWQRSPESRARARLSRALAISRTRTRRPALRARAETSRGRPRSRASLGGRGRARARGGKRRNALPPRRARDPTGSPRSVSGLDSHGRGPSGPVVARTSPGRGRGAAIDWAEIPQSVARRSRAGCGSIGSGDRGSRGAAAPSGFSPHRGPRIDATGAGGGR